MKILLIGFGLPFILILLWIHICNAGRRYPEFTDSNCIRTIVGEYARNDSFGMSLLAHCIRNRGTLKGFYGFNAPHSKKESTEIWNLATKTWHESKTSTDFTKGATEFRSYDDVRLAGSPGGFELTAYYQELYFYKKGGKSHVR